MSYYLHNFLSMLFSWLSALLEGQPEKMKAVLF